MILGNVGDFMYYIILSLGSHPLCEVHLKSITQVAKFIDTIDFSLCKVEVLSPKGAVLDPFVIRRIWNA